MRTAKQLLITVAVLLCCTVASAHYFEVGGIYYNIISSSDLTVEVTYKGNNYSSYDDEYSGAVVIPQTVTYNSKTYSVTRIGRDAFYDCTGLTSVTIPNSVTTIESWAFSNCTGLTSITIPNSVTTIGSKAFDNTAWYNNQPDGLVYAGKVLYKYKGTMLQNTSIVIEDGTLGIAGSAFFGCTGLTSVTIPNSVTTIGSGAFEDCTGLTSIEIPNSVTTIEGYAFRDCTGLTSVTIPNSVTSIGFDAFIGCTGLTSITIPNSVTTIGDNAFEGCTDLTSITIGNSVTTIGSGAFYNTAWYNNQPDGLVYAGKVLYKYKGTMPQNTSIIIKDGTLGIGEYAFCDCTGLTSVTIPNSVTTIGDWVFEYCTGLTSIEIPSSVTTIGSGAFWGCTGLTSIEIPSNVTTIGDWAFCGCSSLTSVTIPNSVTTIGHFVFSGCTGLTSATIPNSVTTIGEYAFDRCTGLTSVTIPNSVTTIGDWAFCNCTGLTSVTIPNSVTTIEHDAFSGCTGLTSIYLLGETPPAVGSSNFTETQYKNTILYVPAGTLETYRNADTWKNFLNIQEVAAPGTPGVGTKKCATPVISYNNCGLDITCDTDEAEIHTTIKCSDANSYNSGRIDLSATYEITTYATLAGYEDSEIATATLCWVEKESDSTDIIEVIGNPVLICTNNGNIVVKGAEAGTEIAVYNINGAMQGTATANGSEVVINTSLGKGDIAIINIGSKAIKVVMQ